MVAGAIEGIRVACVLYNQGKQEITLFYEATSELPPRSLREPMSTRLPRYMLPTVFRWMKAMPMNANGKTNRVELAKLL